MNQESAFSRLWNTLKPPPADNRPPLSPHDLELRRRRRKLIYLTLGVVLVVGGGVGIYNYMATAPLRADAEYQAGMKMMGPGKYPEAVAHFNRAIEIRAQYPEAYLERANAHRILSEMDAALADYQAAADLNPNLAPAHNGIAMIYLERHDSAHALEHLNRSIALQPSTDGYYQRGEIFESQGEHQKAIEDYDRAIDQDRDAPFVYLARAIAKQKLGDEDGARADRLIAAKIQRRF